MAAKKTLRQVVAEGDRRASLEALRDTIAATIDAGVEPKDLAALVRRLEVILVELDQISPTVGSVTGIDDALAARRRAKDAAAG